ncbi:hypothetical protein [Micromonospora sp. WMMD737]|uniref:hypothetical protein n=1 Tax=Micromonospora sp. WMMD737 TaxID=3404113 RepID=UPI003B93058B
MTATVDTQANRNLVGRVKAAHCEPGGSNDAYQLAVLAETMLREIGRARDALRRSGCLIDEVGDDLAALIDRNDTEARDAIRTLALENARLRAGTDRLTLGDHREEWAAEVTYLDGRKQRQQLADAEHAALVADSITTHVASLNEPTRKAHGVKSAAIVTRTVTAYGPTDLPTLVISPWQHHRDGRELKD